MYVERFILYMNIVHKEHIVKLVHDQISLEHTESSVAQLSASLVIKLLVQQMICTAFLHHSLHLFSVLYHVSEIIAFYFIQYNFCLEEHDSTVCTLL